MSIQNTHSRFYWPLQISGWALYSVVGMISTGIFGATNIRIILMTIIGSGLLLLATHLLRQRAKKNAWTNLPLKKLLPRILVAAISIAVASQSIMSLFLVWVFKLSTLEEYSFAVLGMYIFQTLIILLLWSLIYFGFQFFRNYKMAEVEKWKLQASLTDAELIALKAQINPHFIFNCLNNIRALVLEDQEKARDMIARLSDLLRYSLRFSQETTVALNNEIEIVKDYLELESIQAEDRLRYTFNIDPETENREIPPMSIQLLVENAVKHGISQLPDGGSISITSKQNADHLEIAVSNTGQIQSNSSAGTGIGLKNAQDRLKLLFGESAFLTLENVAPNRVSATIRIQNG